MPQFTCLETLRLRWNLKSIEKSLYFLRIVLIVIVILFFIGLIGTCMGGVKTL